MDAGSRAEGVLAEHWIVCRDRHPGAFGNDLAHLAKLAEVGVDPAQQPEVHEQQIQMRIADALPQAECAPMDAVRARDGRHDGVDQAEATVAVPMPVEPDAGLHLIEHLADVADDRARAIWSRVTDGVANRDPLRSLPDGGAEKTPKRLWLGPGRVFGYIHDRQLILAGEADRVARVVNHLLDGPTLGILPDGAGADEGGDLNWDADAL